MSAQAAENIYELPPQRPSRPRTPKAAGAFLTIGELAQQLQIEQHVLRFWESKFLQIQPLKRAGGRRYYRPDDANLLRRIQALLYRDGYTIRGVQNLLASEQSGQSLRSASEPETVTALQASLTASNPAANEDPNYLRVRRADLEKLLQELIDLRQLLAAE